MPQILFYLVDLCGPKLVKVYGRHAKGVLEKITRDYVPAVKQYIARGDIAKEPQNKREYFDEEPTAHDTGVHEAGQYLERLANKVKELL